MGQTRLLPVEIRLRDKPDFCQSGYYQKKTKSPEFVSPCVPRNGKVPSDGNVDPGVVRIIVGGVEFHRLAGLIIGD